MSIYATGYQFNGYKSFLLELSIIEKLIFGITGLSATTNSFHSTKAQTKNWKAPPSKNEQNLEGKNLNNTKTNKNIFYSTHKVHKYTQITQSDNHAKGSHTHSQTQSSRRLIVSQIYYIYI